jgi:site-specific DNA-methyltransferase (cytosine-N4-specific)
MTDYLNKCHFGDVRDVLRQMIANGVKVQTIVTSPPYWGLRSYLPADHIDKAREIGSEPTLREFLDTMVGVFDLCRQVLSDDGTMWVNMGDSYAANRGIQPNPTNTRNKTGHIGDQKVPVGLKAKDLVGQPWRLAFALQDAGWYLRQDIIWAKPNPMPESVRDRCTKAHEYIFLLSKSATYYFDQGAILEPVSASTHARLSQDVQAQIGSARANGGGKTNDNMKAVGRGVGWGHGTDAEQRNRGRVKNNASFNEAMAIMPTERNRRSVWTVPTESYKGAHFATFPRALIEPCILAGAPAGGVVLDIFMGSGTTAQVAEQLGRKWIGIDIDIRNKALQDERLRQPSLDLEAA